MAVERAHRRRAAILIADMVGITRLVVMEEVVETWIWDSIENWEESE